MVSIDGGGSGSTEPPVRRVKQTCYGCRPFEQLGCCEAKPLLDSTSDQGIEASAFDKRMAYRAWRV